MRSADVGNLKKTLSGGAPLIDGVRELESMLLNEVQQQQRKMAAQTQSIGSPSCGNPRP
jgi:hypothetical protein